MTYPVSLQPLQHKIFAVAPPVNEKCEASCSAPALVSMIHPYSSGYSRVVLCGHHFDGLDASSLTLMLVINDTRKKT